MCGSCHYDNNTRGFTGKRLEDSPNIVGKIYAPNITSDSTAAIFAYSDVELKYLLRTGISKDGKLMPYMLRPNLADEDIDAIITFLRSGDSLVAPKPGVKGTTRYTFIGKFGLSRSRPVSYSVKKIRRPESGTPEMGKYLVDNLGCFHCHSKSFLALNYQSPEESKGYMGGGNKLKGANGRTISTPNLTFDETGLAGWSEEDFHILLRNGITPDKKIVRYPMPLYPELTKQETTSIYLYLKQIPFIENEIR